MRILKMSILAASLAATLQFSANAEAATRVLVGHFAPFADTVEGTSVSVRVNGATVLEGVTFGAFTDYLELPGPGAYQLEVLPSGTNTVAISANVNLDADTDYTVLAVGDGSNQPLELLPLVDDNSAPADGNLKVRIVHAAPFAPTLAGTEVSIRTDGGDLVAGLTGIPFKAATGYLELPAGTYDLKVANNDGSVNLIDLVPLDLPAGLNITVLAVGDGSNQPLGFTAIPLGALPIEVPADRSASGVWSVDDGDGQHLLFSAIPAQNRLLGSWLTFDPAGTGQVWFALDSCNGAANLHDCPDAGSFQGDGGTVGVYRTLRGRFNQPLTTFDQKVGTATLRYTDCNTAILSYALGSPFGSGSVSLTRETPAEACPAN